MKTLNTLLNEYGESHQNKTNKLIHWICVPVIFFSVVGLLASIPAPYLKYLMGQGAYSNWAAFILIPIYGYYFFLSRSVAVGMILFSIACLQVADWISNITSLWLVCVVLFVLAWIVQFMGHKVEGKKPSFLKDVQFLLIGPAWLLHQLYRKLGIPV